MATKTEAHAAAVDRDMKKLKASMRGMQIRTAGFKKDHDNLARAIAQFTVALCEAEALVTVATQRGKTTGGRRRTRGGRSSGTRGGSTRGGGTR